MPEERPLVEEVLDYALYAPIGLLLTVTEDLPKLVQRGRARIEGQLGIARFVGKLALRRLRSDVDDLLHTEPRSDVTEVGEVIDIAAPRCIEDTPSVGSGEHLAIPGYDALAASQVVARLSALTADELDAVRAYEGATRHRRTILNRVAQLQEADGRGA